jgi:hypothetical protein
MARRRGEPVDAIVRGTTNVFADLGYPDAEERQTKLRLAFASTPFVMARLVRAIHELIFCGRCRTVRQKKLVDGRNKSGRDGVAIFASWFAPIALHAAQLVTSRPNETRSTGQPLPGFRDRHQEKAPVAVGGTHQCHRRMNGTGRLGLFA